MLKFALLAVAAAILVAIGLILLPTAHGPRQEARIIAPSDTGGPPDGFVIHDAPPAAPSAPAAPGDLAAAIQRLRDTAPKPDPAAAPAPDATPVLLPTVVTPAPPPAAPPPPAPLPANRWTSVTGQGTRWRMARSGDGFTVSVDLGGGQVADIHVLPAFANLDPAAVNVRVDYLKDTILQNFTAKSGSYTFARDGSVSVGP